MITTVWKRLFICNKTCCEDRCFEDCHHVTSPSYAAPEIPLSELNDESEALTIWISREETV